jgi:hypothetical protein
MPRETIPPKTRRTGAAPALMELSRWDRQWIIGRGDRRFLSHRMEAGMTILEWLCSGPGKALTARYPFLAPDLWGVINENRTDESDEAESVLEDALWAEAGMPGWTKEQEAAHEAEVELATEGLLHRNVVQ